MKMLKELLIFQLDDEVVIKPTCDYHTDYKGCVLRIVGISRHERNGEIDIEIRIGVGKGYTVSEENILVTAPVDYLSLDSVFNPVTKVTFTVTPLPGEKESLEVLNIEVTTDGSISPQDAIRSSASVIACMSICPKAQISSSTPRATPQPSSRQSRSWPRAER